MESPLVLRHDPCDTQATWQSQVVWYAVVIRLLHALPRWLPHDGGVHHHHLGHPDSAARDRLSAVTHTDAGAAVGGA